jgi:outer membrane receptor protein involved in Fe transport
VDFFGQIDIGDPGLSLIGSDNGLYQFLQENLTFKNSLSLSRGNHSFRMGGEITRFFYNNTSCVDCGGLWTFATLEDFLRGTVMRVEMNVADEQGLGLSPPHFVTQWQVGSYFQDNWRVRPSLTLNLGIRYEFVTIPGGDEAKTSALRNFNDPSATVGPPWTNATKKSFSPRVGFAWAPG